MTVPLLAAYALSSWRGSVQRFRLSSMLRASQKTCLQMHRPRGGIDLDPRALHGFLQQQWYAEFASDEDFSDDDGHATDADDLDVAAALPGGAGGADAAAALPGGAGGADAAAAAPGGVGGADAAAAAPGGVGGADADPPARPQLPLRPTAQFYISVGNLALHPHTTITVLQACYSLLKIKVDYGIHDAGFDVMLKAVSAFLPQGHYLPRYVALPIRRSTPCSSSVVY